MANVYKAQATSSLSAVGFYATAMNTSYEVWAGSSFSTLSLQRSGTLTTMGYHTVSLQTPVTLTYGKPFVVAVKLTTPGNDCPLANECSYPGYSDYATASAGQSYCSSDGTSWTDLASFDDSANFCLKAYTTGDTAPSGDDIPGLPLTDSSVSGALDSSSNPNDVYSVELNAGDTLEASIDAGSGTNFDLYLFPPDATTVADKEGAVAQALTYGDPFTYVVPTAGTYYLDAYAVSGSGAYHITYTVISDDDIPGFELPASPVTGDLSVPNDLNDVYSFSMTKGHAVSMQLTQRWGDEGANFDLYLFPPGTSTISKPRVSTIFASQSAGIITPDRRPNSNFPIPFSTGSILC